MLQAQNKIEKKHIHSIMGTNIVSKNCSDLIKKTFWTSCFTTERNITKIKGGIFPTSLKKYNVI